MSTLRRSHRRRLLPLIPNGPEAIEPSPSAVCESRGTCPSPPTATAHVAAWETKATHRAVTGGCSPRLLARHRALRTQKLQSMHVGNDRKSRDCYCCHARFLAWGKRGGMMVVGESM